MIESKQITRNNIHTTKVSKKRKINREKKVKKLMDSPEVMKIIEKCMVKDKELIENDINNKFKFERLRSLSS